MCTRFGVHIFPLFSFGTRFEIFTAVEIQVEVFWVVTACSIVVGYQCHRGPNCLHFHVEDGGSMAFILPQHYTASQPRSKLEFLFRTLMYSY